MVFHELKDRTGYYLLWNFHTGKTTRLQDERERGRVQSADVFSLPSSGGIQGKFHDFISRTL